MSKIPSLFASFNHAVRAMQHSQHALTVHGSNIANANDPSYTRKDVLHPSDARPFGPGVARLRDAFIDDQYRRSSGVMGDAEIRRNVLSKVEDIFGDPVNGGLRQAIDQFYDSWQGLAENPSDGVARMQVLAAGKGFAQQVRDTYQRLSAVEQTVNEELAVRVSEVNEKLSKVFGLNKKISEMARHHMDDASLRDQRDKVMDELAKLTGAQALQQGDGTIRVIIGSTVVVDGPTVIKLTLKDTPDGPKPSWVGYPTPTYGGTGTIGGLVRVRDEEIKHLKADIDNLGRSVAERVNAQHRLGKGLDGLGGRDFFVMTAAPADLMVDPALSTEMLAAGAGAGAGQPSDGENARALMALGDAATLESVIIPGQIQPPRVFYRNLVGWLGAKTQDAVQGEEIAKTHIQITEEQRQAQWGVSLDEEVAKLSVEQKAFAAAARVISVMDEMLDTLINRT